MSLFDPHPGHALSIAPGKRVTFHDDGAMTGAACWRADGTPIGVSGGHARKGVRFWPDRVKPV
jgi:gamma-glutamyltranspeptidase/glutathione hydrolase